MLRHKRIISLIAMVAFFFSMIGAVAICPQEAFASSSYEVLSAPYINNGDSQTLGSISITIDDVFACGSSDFVTVKMPSGCEFHDYLYQKKILVSDETDDVDIDIPEIVGSAANPLISVSEVYGVMASPNTLELYVANPTDCSGEGQIELSFNDIDVSGIAGDIGIAMIAPFSGTTFTNSSWLFIGHVVVPDPGGSGGGAGGGGGAVPGGGGVVVPGLPSQYQVISAPYVTIGDSQKLGSIAINIDNVYVCGAMDKVAIKLPNGCEFHDYTFGQEIVAGDYSSDVQINIPYITSNGVDNALYSIPDNVKAVMTSPSTLDLYVANPSGLTGGGKLYLAFNDIDISGINGNIGIGMVAASDSAFTSTTSDLIIGRVATGGGTVMLTNSVKKISRATGQQLDSIILVETLPGSIKPGDAMTLTLPSGFSWDLTGAVIAGGWTFSGRKSGPGGASAITTAENSSFTGDIQWTAEANDRILTVSFPSTFVPSTNDGTGRLSLGINSPSEFGSGYFHINVPNEAANGDVRVSLKQISGEGSIDDAEIRVATIEKAEKDSVNKTYWKKWQQWLKWIRSIIFKPWK